MVSEGGDGGHYDPDEHEEAVRAITAERFGVLIASTILSNPRSQYWMLVHQAIEEETGWQVEHEDLEPFLENLVSDSGFDSSSEGVDDG